MEFENERKSYTEKNKEYKSMELLFIELKKGSGILFGQNIVYCKLGKQRSMLFILHC